TRVVWAEPNFRSQIAQQVVGQPNDPLLPFQWHLQNRGQGGGKPGADIKAMPAWQTTTGSETIIAILDDGTETTHPDLKGNLAINTAEVPDDGIDEDGNGYIDDVSGWDFYSNYSPGSGSNDPNPKTQYDNHGTAVAGVAVAQGGNGAGVAGAAYSSRLLPVRVLKTTDELGNGWTQGPTAIAEAVYYAAGR